MAAGRAEKDSQVYDLFAIPDYVKFFTPMLGELNGVDLIIFPLISIVVDKKFARYCKTNYTQHQFSFERAEDGVSQYLIANNLTFNLFPSDRYALSTHLVLRCNIEGMLKMKPSSSGKWSQLILRMIPTCQYLPTLLSPYGIIVMDPEYLCLKRALCLVVKSKLLPSIVGQRVDMLK